MSSLLQTNCDLKYILLKKILVLHPLLNNNSYNKCIFFKREECCQKYPAGLNY